VVKRRKIQIFEQMFSSDPIRGHLAKDRLRSLLEQMRIMDPAVHEFLWRQYDTDYNGKIDFQEFCSMMFDVMDIKKSFEAADDNGDKALSVDEMYTVLSHLDISFERVTIDAIMDLFDKNHDGSVDFGEFFPLSIFLHGLISKYNEFLDTRNAGEAHWLRTLLGGDKEKEAEVAKELNNLVNDGAIPSIDAFARVIIAAAKETDFKGKVKAPQITNVRVKELPSEKVKKAIPRAHTGKGHVPIEFEGVFEDPEFPPDDDILPPALADKVTWRRPNEINPERQELFVDGVEEGDVIQGSLGDCWFLGALAVVAASSHNYVKDIFVEADPERGYYVCKFFKNGEWVYVHIDDRLPCRVTRVGGVYLCFASCRDEGEFWVPLVEKAYAKLHGSYDALEGGNICDALKDLTGGAIETVRWKDQERDAVWEKIRTLNKKNCLMGCAIDASNELPESKLDCGLLANHAYSILKAKEVDGIKFLRIRNPWGQGEWTGDWSDNSPLWTPEWKGKGFVKNYTFKDDGTFFMRFEDFIKYFNRLFVMRSIHESFKHNGQWKGLNAQGCRNNPYWLQNPQYAIKTTEPNTTIYINLSQPDLRYELKQNPEKIRSVAQREYESVGIYILKTNDPQYKKMVYHDEDKAGSSAFTDVRDLSFEFECPKPDTYVLLPCTYHAKKEASYHISLYSESPIEVLELPAKKSESLNGRWIMGSTAGGCTNHRATFMTNPQFLLQCTQSNCVDILLAQSGSKTTEPLGVYVFAAESDTKLTVPAKLIQRPTEMLEAVSVSTSLNVDAHESYIIMPATIDPAETDFTITVISEHIKTFRML